MAYADIRQYFLNGVGTDLQTQATGNFAFFSCPRPYTLIGFGSLATVAWATKVTAPVIKMQKGPYTVGGVTFADIANYTATLDLATRGLNLGDVVEVSALLKAVDPTTGKAPVAPMAYVASTDANAGDVVAINLATQGSFTTHGAVMVYVLIVHRGS